MLADYGSNYGRGTAEHHLTLTRHASGALVFGAGTVQWSLGLDNEHDGDRPAPSVSMQQATVNLLAEHARPVAGRADRGAGDVAGGLDQYHSADPGSAPHER